MTFDELLASMTPAIHETMKQALEIGKWPDGRRLTDDERETCMQAVIAYDALHVAEEERVGYIDRSKKTVPCDTAAVTSTAESQTLTIKDSTTHTATH